MNLIRNYKVCAIDPGSNKAGISIVGNEEDKIKLIESHQVKLIGQILEERLSYLYSYLDVFVARTKPNAIALEETFVAPFDDKSGKYKFNLDAPLKLSMARGLVWAIAGKYNIKVHEYSNGDVKRTVTRNYQATKSMMIKAISKAYGKDFEEDEADSIAIGITHLIAMKLQNKEK